MLRSTVTVRRLREVSLEKKNKGGNDLEKGGFKTRSERVRQ